MTTWIRRWQSKLFRDNEISVNNEYLMRMSNHAFTIKMLIDNNH